MWLACCFVLVSIVRMLICRLSRTVAPKKSDFQHVDKFWGVLNILRVTLRVRGGSYIFSAFFKNIFGIFYASFSKKLKNYFVHFLSVNGFVVDVVLRRAITNH